MNHDMIARLSRYLSVLNRLKSLGLVRVFSDNLGDALGVSASLVRKDFFYFGLHGNKRGGYAVDELIDRLRAILGRDQPRKIVIVGCGKIGTALMNYQGFGQEGIRVAAGFDIDPAVINPEAPCPILDIARLPAFVKKEQIDVAVLAIPEAAVTGVSQRLREAGVSGILNFTPVPLRDLGDCIVQNINLAMEIENIFARAHFARQRTGDKPTAAKRARGA